MDTNKLGAGNLNQKTWPDDDDDADERFFGCAGDRCLNSEQQQGPPLLKNTRSGRSEKEKDSSMGSH